MTIWPMVPMFYSDCKTDEHRLKQRIRRAFEKSWGTPLGEASQQELADVLFHKIFPSITGMKPPESI